MTAATTIEHRHGSCGRGISRCGAIARIDQGRFIGLDPDPSHPTGKALCAKGRAAPDLVYHPDRLRSPIEPTRPKTDPDPGWERISWDIVASVVSRCRRVSETGVSGSRARRIER
jgi:anaerobic selenocysteine-containing dehydrogenase